MDIGQIDAGRVLDQLSRRLPGDFATGPRTDAARTDGNARQGDDVSLARRSLSILGREIRQVLSSEFNFRFKAAPGYGDAATGRGRIASDVKATGRALLAATPLGASDQLSALRERIQNAAAETRGIVGNSSDVDSALGQIEDTLDDLDTEAARNVASSASVLSYESRLKQRSVITIRTQEGDFVKLDLRRKESIEASDLSFNSGGLSVTETEIDFSSRSRFDLKVKGDINEAEMAAIQTVLEQASAAADEFYGGDLAAAFDELSGLEFDAEQLSRVKVRFRERLETNLSFAGIKSFEPAPVAAPQPTVVPGTEVPILRSLPTDVIAPAREKAEPELTPSPSKPLVDTDSEVAAPVIIEPAAPIEPAADPFDGLAGLLADFLNRSNSGFEAESSSYRFFYKESFKLQLLKSVFEVAAPDESGDAAKAAAAAIDAASDVEAE